MYKEFDTIEDLYQWMEEDKSWTGAEANQFNRYPLRFVLFENFHDFRAFADECQNHSVFVQSMEGWMAEGCDDQMLTNSQLARRFKEYVENIPVNDFVIAPFSEVTRFYENEKYAEFDSLLKTIRLIEASENAQQNHQRIYVPIIGIIIEDIDSVSALNSLLHEYGDYIIGRMGIPYRQKKINIISIAMDGPQDTINALSGKIGRLKGISSKTIYSNR